MENKMDYSPEELEKMLEEAKKKAQEAFDRMTPEEREQAQLRFQKTVEEDASSMDKLIKDAEGLLSGAPASGNAAPKFCKSCGAPASGGKFCEFCGSLL